MENNLHYLFLISHYNKSFFGNWTCKFIPNINLNNCYVKLINKILFKITFC